MHLGLPLRLFKGAQLYILYYKICVQWLPTITLANKQNHFRSCLLTMAISINKAYYCYHTKLRISIFSMETQQKYPLHIKKTFQSRINFNYFPITGFKGTKGQKEYPCVNYTCKSPEGQMLEWDERLICVREGKGWRKCLIIGNSVWICLFITSCQYLGQSSFVCVWQGCGDMLGEWNVPCVSSQMLFKRLYTNCWWKIEY